MRLRKTAVATAALAMVTVPATAASANADDGAADDAITRVSDAALSGPRQVNDFEDGTFVVAESDSGEISSVDPETGDVDVLLKNLASPQGVDYGNGLLFVAVGGPPPPGEAGPPVPAGAVFASLIVAEPDGTVVDTIDLEKYERDNNPDGQVQFVNGKPVDALSNPYAVLAQDDRVLVADGGANDVLSIDESGEVSTFFVPPTVKGDEVAACGAPDAQANPGTKGCDPVPTGVEEGPDGLIYVSTLGAEAPGAAKVYVLTPDGEDVVRVIDGLTGVAGLAVDSEGTVYVSELLEGAPEGAPAAGFDPATVGRIVRIDTDDNRSVSQVTMPTGLDLHHGRLYASAWSIISQLPIPAPPAGVGQLVRVGDGTFEPLP